MPLNDSKKPILIAQRSKPFPFKHSEVDVVFVATFASGSRMRDWELLAIGSAGEHFRRGAERFIASAADITSISDSPATTAGVAVPK